MTIKEHLHHVVEQMTDEEAEATLRRIDAQRTDPFLCFLDAEALDDEPVTADEYAAVAEVDPTMPPGYRTRAGAERAHGDRRQDPAARPSLRSLVAQTSNWP